MKHFPRTLSFLGLLLLTNSCGGEAHRLGDGADGLGSGDENTGGAGGAGNTDGDGNGTDACSSLDAAVCEANDGCALAVGARYDPAEVCFGPGTISKCVEANCGDAMITWAEDPSGDQWAFNDSCIPEGWTTVFGPSDPAATSAPTCSGSDPNDPCAGVDLPECAPRCDGNMGDLAGQPCTPGDECIISTVGDECACGSDGTWGCAVHPPLGMGCNLTCDEGDANTDAGSTAGDPGADGSTDGTNPDGDDAAPGDPDANGGSDPDRP